MRLLRRRGGQVAAPHHGPGRVPGQLVRVGRLGRALRVHRDAARAQQHGDADPEDRPRAVRAGGQQRGQDLRLLVPQAEGARGPQDGPGAVHPRPELQGLAQRRPAPARVSRAVYGAHDGPRELPRRPGRHLELWRPVRLLGVHG